MFIAWIEFQREIEEGNIIENGQGKYKEKECFSNSGACIDLKLGNEVYLTSDQIPKKIGKNEIININPGQFAALTTEETLKIPNKYLGFITIKFSYKSKGLINVSGFHVDPSYKGLLIFTVYNIGPRVISLQQGQPIFSLFLAEIKEGAMYTKPGFEGIPLDIVQSLSGAQGSSLYELNNKIEKLDLIVKIYGSIVMTIVGILLGKFLGWI